MQENELLKMIKALKKNDLRLAINLKTILLMLFILLINNKAYATSPISIPLDIFAIQTESLNATASNTSKIFAQNVTNQIENIYEVMSSNGDIKYVEDITPNSSKESITNTVDKIIQHPVIKVRTQLSENLNLISKSIETTQNAINIKNVVSSVISTPKIIKNIVDTSNNLVNSLTNILKGDPQKIQYLISNSDTFHKNPSTLLNQIRGLNTVELVDTIKDSNEIKGNINALNKILNNVIDNVIVNLQKEKLSEYNLVQEGATELLIQDFLIQKIKESSTQEELISILENQNLYDIEIEDGFFSTKYNLTKVNKITDRYANLY